MYRINLTPGGTIHPVIFGIGAFKLHSYGLMIFTAFALGLWLQTRRGEKVGIKASDSMDFVFWIMVASLIGARASYVIVHWEEYAAHPLDAISPFQSDGSVGIAGLIVLGGVIAAIPTAWYFAKKRKIDFMTLTDVTIPGLAFGLAIGRIGCFLNGCCFGLPTDVAWGVTFPETCLAGSQFPNQTIHPTQVYDFLYNTAIGLFMLWWSSRKKFEGELFALFLILYGFARFWVEAFRYYEAKRIPLNLAGVNISGSAIISIAMIAGGIYLIMKKRKTAGGKR